MKLIFGLGNPGAEYKLTRHNIGFILLDHFYEKNKDIFSIFKEDKKLKAEISEGELNGEKILLAKPSTFMNLSGESLKLIKNFYKINIENILIIQDDKDMEYGKLRMKNEESGDGGHNGIKSIIQELKTKKLKRLKFGVGNHNLEKMPTDRFVLGNFSKQEIQNIKDNIDVTINKIIENI